MPPKGWGSGSEVQRLVIKHSLESQTLTLLDEKSEAIEKSSQIRPPLILSVSERLTVYTADIHQFCYLINI